MDSLGRNGRSVLPIAAALQRSPDGAGTRPAARPLDEAHYLQAAFKPQGREDVGRFA